MGHCPRRLLDQVRETIQRKHYSRPTEESYAHWIKHYILFHNKRHRHLDHIAHKPEPSLVNGTRWQALLYHRPFANCVARKVS